METTLRARCDCIDQMPWLKTLLGFQSLSELKGFLLSRYPALNGRPFPDAVVAGASHIAQNIIPELLRNGSRISAVFDDDPGKTGTSCHGIPICRFHDIATIDTSVPVIIATQRIGDVQKKLATFGFESILPFPVLSIYKNRVFRAHPFYASILQRLLKGREALVHLAGTLADDKSRTVLDAIIGFRMTFDARVYDGLLDDHAYFARDVLAFHARETVVDGGAFNGDTVRQFKDLSGDAFKRIIALEPSERIFDELSGAFRHDERIQPLKACLYHRNAILHFDTTGARDSAIATLGGSDCGARTIDSLTDADEITFIKLNIEGAERNALRGARRVIGRQHPKLAVAVYHRPSDLWEIPKLITTLFSGYRLYLRQHNAGIIESVIYAVPRRPSDGRQEMVRTYPPGKGDPP